MVELEAPAMLEVVALVAELGVELEAPEDAVPVSVSS